MKKTFTFPIAFVLCTSLFAQKENNYQQLKSTLSAGQKPDSTITSVMDNGWKLQTKLVYHYDGNKQETLNYSWEEELSSWSIQIKTLDTFNENGDRINQFRMAMNPISGQWDTLSNHTYIYDPVLGITSWDYDSWNQTTHSWNDLMKGEYDYFENGHEQTYLLCQWNTSLSRWDSSYFALWIMNTEGKDSTGTYYRWTTQDSPRYIDYHYWISYDENGNDTLFYQEDPANPESKNKYVTLYNDNGFKMQETSYDWLDNAWLGTYRTEYAYDDDGNLVLSTSQEWNATGQEWLSVRKEQNYYAIETATHNNSSETDLLVYPNPASEYLRIKFDNASSSATFRLYNMNGTKVIDGKIYSNTIRVGHLLKGVYLYQFNDSGKVFRGRVVLK
jgi:hypothetical protein